MLLRSAVFSTSNHFKLHQFAPTTTQLLWEAFSHAAMRVDYSITFPPMSIARYSFIQLRYLGVNEIACLRNGSKGDSNCQLRVQHSTTELSFAPLATFMG